MKSVGTAAEALAELTRTSLEAVKEQFCTSSRPKPAVAEALKCLCGLRGYMTATALWLCALGEFRRLVSSEDVRSNWLTSDNEAALAEDDSMAILPFQGLETRRRSRQRYSMLCKSLFVDQYEEDRCILVRTRLRPGRLEFCVAIDYEGLVAGIEEAAQRIVDGTEGLARGTSTALLHMHLLSGLSVGSPSEPVMRPGALAVESEGGRTLVKFGA